MLRFSLSLVLLVLFAAPEARAFRADEMQLEFDARVLTDDEKRFIQTGLAFANAYNGLLDGAWGEGSQRALEAYEVRNGRTAFVTNADVLFLALETYETIERHGWVRQYNSALDMSFLVPTIGFQEGAPSDSFLHMELSGTSLGYSLTIGTGPQTERLHQYTAEESVVNVYQVRRPNLWITSGRTQAGITLYTRSDYRRGAWSSIMLSANDGDAGLLAAVTGSIEPGYAPQIGISQGVLSRGIETLAAMAEDEPPATSPPAPAVSDSTPGPGGSQGFGTGFLVSDRGDYLTNNHVVRGCRTLTVGGQPATVIATDEGFDLALLRSSTPPEGTPAQFAAKPARLNSDVTVVGYPLPDLLGGVNVTRGSVTSLKGIAGDGVRMQISAPVQPGNSGGPVVNAAGQVVGVVVAKLDAQMVAEVTGDIPQNINFAIRGEIAKLFLYQNGVEPLDVADAPALPPEDLADLAQGFTRLITCN
ncbi:MAG: serine protease [Tabrizicola sp.]